VVLQYCAGSSEVRLQSQEFVAYFLSDYTRPTILGTLLVPDFQGVPAFFEQSLILVTGRHFDGALFVHTALPSLTLMHFVRQQR
jgi:hypothetical protein